MRYLFIAIVFIGSFSACVSEFEGELESNIFENLNESFLEITNHEKDVDFVEIFYTNSLNFLEYERIKGIVFFENGARSESIIEDPNRTSFVRSNLIPSRQYCYQIAIIDEDFRILDETEEYCFVF